MAKTKVIPVRMDAKMHELVSEYAILFGMNKSEALREIIKEGLITKSHVGLLKNWQRKAIQRNPKLEVTNCEKDGCERTNDLIFYHIDGNIMNWRKDNIAVLCKPCVIRLQDFIQKYNPKEKFAAWFFYE